MLIASLVLAVVANVGDDPNYYGVENWKGAAMADMETCATMARDLNEGFDVILRQGLPRDWHTKYASCELIVIDDDSDEGAEHTAAKAVSAPVSLTF